jgi:hypothetical protein
MAKTKTTETAVIPPVKPDDQPAITKADAIRKVIIEMGGPSKVKKNGPVITRLAELGFKTNSNEVSIYKNKLKKASGRAAKASKDGPKGNRSSVSLDDLEALKSLVNRIGSEEVKRALDILG